jgi:hypothetical protein
MSEGIDLWGWLYTGFAFLTVFVAGMYTLRLVYRGARKIVFWVFLAPFKGMRWGYRWTQARKEQANGR